MPISIGRQTGVTQRQGVAENRTRIRNQGAARAALRSLVFEGDDDFVLVDYAKLFAHQLARQIAVSRFGIE